MSELHAEFSLNGKVIPTPVREPTLGLPAADIKQLGAQGVYTFDPGFYSTVSCASKITYIDGKQGQLLYGGYAIEALSHHADYLSVFYLLMHGELPTTQEKLAFTTTMVDFRMGLPDLAPLFKAMPIEAHPMSMVHTAVAALAGHYPACAWNDKKGCLERAMRLVAVMPLLAAMAFKRSQGGHAAPARADLGHAENMLQMMLGEQALNPLYVQALERILILHADHEQNASTSTVRLAGSTGTHPYAAAASGVAALWGAAHGGANEACLNMLQEIGQVDRIDHFIARAKDPSDPFRLMGFGHRVYKSYDPRATIMRDTCHDVLAATGKKDEPLFVLAMKLEQIALEDPYFVERKLYPNVDFYSGLTQSALGIPSHLFTVMFAVSRSAGWMAHWLEMVSADSCPIGRPRQLYVGPVLRDLK